MYQKLLLLKNLELVDWSFRDDEIDNVQIWNFLQTNLLTYNFTSMLIWLQNEFFLLP